MLVRWIGLVGGLVLVLSGTPAVAQSAEAYFHEAAQQYVAGNKQAARQAVERGLEVAPSDPRLQALREKLNQASDDRGGGGGGSQQGASNQSQSQSKQSRGDGGQEQQSEASGKEGQQQGAQDEEASAPQSAPSQQTGGAGSAGGGGPRSGNPPAQTGGRAGQRSLTREQAARLLRALQTQEMKLLREVQGQDKKAKASVGKDW